jgi:hypothetical protein
MVAEGRTPAQILKSALPVGQVYFPGRKPGIIVNRVRISIAGIASQRGNAATQALRVHLGCECQGADNIGAGRRPKTSP